jgi:hypothetical protein
MFMGVKVLLNKNYRENCNMVDVQYISASFMICEVIKQRSECIRTATLITHFLTCLLLIFYTTVH